MKTIEELKKALKIDRAGFIKGLIAAGYVDTVVYRATESDHELLRLATGIYNDLWDSFNVKEFESWNYYLKK